MFLASCIALVLMASREPLPELAVIADNTAIDHSCRVVIASDAVITDSDGNGVIQIEADGVTVEFAEGSVLRGAKAAPEIPDDRLTGVGIRVVGHSGVTIKSARIEGFKVAIHATEANGLTIDGATVNRNFRQRLRSTPMSEDQADWLWPHKNDDHEWRTNYGAAVCIERSKGVTVCNTRVRNSQNGIILDRVNDSRIYDNDCSFLSGWGLAMWRSSGNLIGRNAFDFCIRGYSHGVYNRGQDSAGILCFEQCSHNRFIENSATHCGDGFFGFAGREALGEAPPPAPQFDYSNRGCNDNLLLGNDFSFAAAHGIELTFSFDNRFENNTLAGNAICGIWGGYSQRMTIKDNTITDNGQPGSKEGGGINVEHGANNLITDNNFAGNSVAISLWSDADDALMKLPWAVANHRGSTANTITANRFENEAVFLRLRKTTETVAAASEFVNTPEAPDADAESEVTDRRTADQPGIRDGPAVPPGPGSEPIGESRPVNARAKLAGREHIIMGEWGPWDHATPMLRLSSQTGARAIHEIYGDAGPVTIDVLEGKGDLETDLGSVEDNLPRTLTLQARAGIQVLPYAVRVQARGIDQTLRGTLVRSPWTATVFSFTADPRTDLDGWRAESKSAVAVTVPCDGLLWMRYLRRGPAEMPMFREAAREGRVPGRERYGVIARTQLDLPAGSWRITTLSDDGIRVLVNGQTILENWTHHAPERNEGTFVQTEAGAAEIVVEYFQLDGFATLEFQIDRAAPAPTSVP